MRRHPKENNHQYILPKDGFLRIGQVLAFFPVSKSTFWEMIRSGQAPAPVKLSRRCVAWRVADIKALIEEHNNAHSRPRQHTGQFEGQTNRG